MQHACLLELCVRGGGRAISGRMRLGSPYCGQGSRDGFSSFTVVLERGGREWHKQWGNHCSFAGTDTPDYYHQVIIIDGFPLDVKFPNFYCTFHSRQT